MIICRGTNETDGRTDGRTDGQLFTPHSGISSHSKGARISMARISKNQCHQCLISQTIYGPFALPTKTVLNSLSAKSVLVGTQLILFGRYVLKF